MSDTKNMTGEQIQKIMDLFLYKALEPVMLYSDVFDSQMSIILTVVATNRKRKLSALDRTDLIANLVTCLTTTDRQEKFELFRSCRVERSFVHGFLRNLINDNRTFLQEYPKFLAGDKDVQVQLNNQAHVNLGTTRANMWRVMQHANSYLEKFFEFRGKILNNYVKLSNSQTKSHISCSPNSLLDYGDLLQSILKATLVALDKYDSSKGALTTYVNWWVLNAQTSSTEHEYGVAYTIPQSHKRKIAEQGSADVNFSVSMDTLIEDEENNLHNLLSDGNMLHENIERLQEVDNVRELVKAVDNSGIARLVLDIGEVFNKQELTIMQKQMKRERIKL